MMPLDEFICVLNPALVGRGASEDTDRKEPHQRGFSGCHGRWDSEVCSVARVFHPTSKTQWKRWSGVYTGQLLFWQDGLEYILIWYLFVTYFGFIFVWRQSLTLAPDIPELTRYRCQASLEWSTASCLNLPRAGTNSDWLFLDTRFSGSRCQNNHAIATFLWRDPGCHREKNIPITQPFLCVAAFQSCLWAGRCLVNGNHQVWGSLIQDEDATQLRGARWGRATKVSELAKQGWQTDVHRKGQEPFPGGEVRWEGFPGERHQEKIWKSYCNLPRKISYFVNFLILY